MGEVRDEAAIDMLQAMNTGHDGSLSTGHANSATDMLGRLETMFLMGMDIPIAAIRNQIASAIDIVIHLGRLRDKSRRVLEISEIKGIRNGEIAMNILYKFVEERVDGERVAGTLKKFNDILNTEKLLAAGNAFSIKNDEEKCYELQKL